MLAGAPRFAPFPRRGEPAPARLVERLPAHVWPAIRDEAEADLVAPLQPLPSRLYHEFREIGRREGNEDAQRERRNRLYRLTLAEWMEGSGRFAPAIDEVAWARLEETNWAWPAHARDLDPPDGPTLDLAAAMTALDMAEMDYLVGDRLPPHLRTRLRAEVERRAIAPFVLRDDLW